ncbi:hypothetical protein ACFY4C_13805 [Actinomadura viridis]|uniref:hypothetical protein n=1 Tax=Actinomadura viridis TaxID=58110 RepID=UPI0036836F4E
MQKTITYRYRAPFAPPRLRYIWATWPLVLITVASVLYLSDHQPLRSIGDVPVKVLVLWPMALIWTIVKVRTAHRQRGRDKQWRPADPPSTASPVALAAGDPAQTTVYFRNGTFVPAGHRDPQEAIAFATDRLATPRDLRDFRANAADGGWLVSFADVTVHLSPDEVKHSDIIDLGRHAAAKISLDARRPDPTHVRAAQQAP